MRLVFIAIGLSGCALGCGARTELMVWGCGDAIIDKGEQCDLGDDNAHRPAILLTHGSLERWVMPFDRAGDLASFYAYTSESSHTGFEDRDLAVMMLYRDTQRWIDGAQNGLGLLLHMGIDEDLTGVTIEHGLVDLSIGPLPDGASIAVGDEPDELRFEGSDRVVGNFEFWRNTDGGAIERLPFPGNWSIDVAVALRDGISRWSYVLHDGGAIALDDALIANLRTFDTPSPCRPDCTVPECGDGILDGGEICDDGNRTSGDGCASDCAALD